MRKAKVARDNRKAGPPTVTNPAPLAASASPDDLRPMVEEMGWTLEALGVLFEDISELEDKGEDQGRGWLIHKAKWAIFDELAGYRDELERLAESQRAGQHQAA